MKFNELNKILGGLEKKSDWRQASSGGWLHKGAKVDNETQIAENAIVWGRVSGNARVHGNAWVHGDAWGTSPLYIQGSRFALTNAMRGHIQIGCYCLTFSEWERRGMELARENKFTADEIREYRAYIELFKKIGK